MQRGRSGLTHVALCETRRVARAFKVRLLSPPCTVTAVSLICRARGPLRCVGFLEFGLCTAGGHGHSTATGSRDAAAAVPAHPRHRLMFKPELPVCRIKVCVDVNLAEHAGRRQSEAGSIGLERNAADALARTERTRRKYLRADSL